MTRNGALAQLGERLLCKQIVVGSIPTGSTKFFGIIGNFYYSQTFLLERREYMEALLVPILVVLLIVIVVFWALNYVPVDGPTSQLIRAVTVIVAAGFIILKLLALI